ncbi:hypothetical protein J4N45_13260 [Vibrio sp. SCSIO 43140]|uniref:hypothetical protein n=1 Tax=Vibrio sp. SCSIO 43140 TaxID=2819100 RepID=UPI002075FB30|nr:hypothetical protein [Vibrio sp. SCSIO 43140]USD59484.1 hypothetical protein J4N45_13260 [Vibrio sp. SCSIO 43140]
MDVNFDVWVDSGKDFSIDMNSGLDTFKGASEVTRKVAETLLTKHVPKQLHHSNKIRTQLRQSFKGSFIQTFALSIDDPVLEENYKKIGKTAFIELLTYFMSEALYQESPDLSKKATSILKKLGDELTEKLVEELRVSALGHLHTVSNNFNQKVQLRYYKNKSKKEMVVLAKLDRATGEVLKPKTDKSIITLEASITRLNINTGNGRLQIKGEIGTTAFGFSQPGHYPQRDKVLKQKLSDNLHVNNVIGPDKKKWKTIKLQAHSQRAKHGRIIKYIIEGIADAK